MDDPATTTTAGEEASAECPLRGCRHRVILTEYPNADRLPTCHGRCDAGLTMRKRGVGQTCRGASAFWRRVARARGYFAGATSADLAGSDRDAAAWRAERKDW